jgi:hypothetical protein
MLSQLRRYSTLGTVARSPCEASARSAASLFIRATLGQTAFRALIADGNPDFIGNALQAMTTIGLEDSVFKRPFSFPMAL